VHPAIEHDKKYKAPQSLKAGKTFTIPVKVTGVPEPTVTWSHNNKPLTSSKKVTLDARGVDHTINIKELKREDAGVYTVSAENVVGRKHAEFELKVLGEFEFFID
jgi:hypothetical protein